MDLKTLAQEGLAGLALLAIFLGLAVIASIPVGLAVLLWKLIFAIS